MDPQPPHQSPISQSVLKRIECERIAMRSRLSVLAERLGLDGMGVLLFLTVVLAVNLIFFWARATGAFSWLGYGRLGWSSFLEAFPYQWLIVAVLALLATTSLLKASDANYRPAYHKLIIGLVLAAGGLGSLAAFSGLNERFLEANERPGYKPTQPLRALTTHHGTTTVVGRIVGIVPGGYLVETNNEQIVILVTNQTVARPPATMTSGDRVMVMSRSATGATIHAIGIRKLPPIPPRHIELHWTLVPSQPVL